MSFRIILLPLLLLSTLLVSFHSLAALDSSWPYKTTVSVSVNTDKSSYVLLEFSSADLYSTYQWSGNGKDLRILAADDSTELGYYIEEWNSSAETARVWVYVPGLTAASNNNFYLYYGNDTAAAVAQIDPPVLVTPGGILYHSRYSNANPASKAQALYYFNSASDGRSGYGRTYLDDFTRIANADVIPAGASTDFILYSESTFTTAVAGTWYFRAGVDFGRGSGLYIDGVALEEQWNDDLWWNDSWDDAEILSGSVNLSEGEHTLLLLGSEGSNGGPMTVQFSGDNSTWSSYSSTYPTATFEGSSENLPPGVDLRTTLTESTNYIQPGSTLNLELSVKNQGADSFNSRYCSRYSWGRCSYNISVKVALPGGLTDSASYTGTDWSCTSRISNGQRVWSCEYQTNRMIQSGEILPPITFTQVSGVSQESALTVNAEASVAESGIESDTSNNSSSALVYVIDAVLNATGTSCSGNASLTNGVWASFYDTSVTAGYINNDVAYQQFVDTYAIEDKLYGRTVLSNIDLWGYNNDLETNPFAESPAENNHFLGIFEGYLYLPETGLWGLGIDGDDDIELWLDGQRLTGQYGGNSANRTSPSETVTVYAEAGYHRLEYRFYENDDAQGYFLYWKTPSGSGYEIIPSSRLKQCSAYTSLSLTAATEVLSDPVNGTSNPKAIPGAVVRYTVTVRNQGTLAPDSGSTEIIQNLDSGMELYVGDGSVSPVTVDAGTLGLSYTYENISSTTDSLEFSSDPSSVTDSDGYATGISSFTLNLGGTMTAGSETNPPSMTYQYQVRLQ